MQILAYFYGIESERRLCEEIEFNIAYRWYCKLSLGDSVPDHSSLTKIRERCGEEIFEKVFNRILDLCREKGLLKGEISVMADATLVKADASLKSLVKKDEHGKAAAEREEAWHAKGQRYSNQTHVSHSDPDSSLAKKAGTNTALYYKVHGAADRTSRVIVDCHVTTGAVHETTVLKGRIEAIEARGIEISEVVADRGYGSSENYEFLDGKGIEHVISLWRPQVGQIETGFEYDSAEEIYRCPEGHKMNPTKDGEAKVFRLSKKICSLCPRYDTCVPEGKYVERGGKKIRRHQNQVLFEAIRKKEKEPDFRAKLWERMWKMEGLFAEGKNLHGLERARYRGRRKIQIQAFMIAGVQNLKRLLSAEIGLLMRIFGCRGQVFETLIFG
jgi:IS5 family transposase